MGASSGGITIPFVVLTATLLLGWAAVMTVSFRAAVARDWDHRRCEPGVVLLSGWFKPAKDPRTAAEFARDNWSFCQKEYVQDAIRIAAQAPAAAASAQASIGGIVSEITGVMADVFFNLWSFCYEMYSSFMERMKSAAKLFHNFLIQMSNIVDRLQGAVVSIVFGLMSLISAFISAVKVLLIVAIIIVGILLALMVILFFLLMPISSMILTMTAVISVMVITVTTAIAAAMVAEMFTPGACFDTGTRVVMADGSAQPIEKIALGARLFGDAGTVTAVHEFETRDGAWTYDGIYVTGDHLIDGGGGDLKPVREEGRFLELHRSGAARRVWCLTTTGRRIPVRGATGSVYQFVDWEEIDDADERRQKAWFSAVWSQLNPDIPLPHPHSAAVKGATQTDAGISPDSEVAVSRASWCSLFGCRNPVFRRACSLAVGDTVLDADGAPTRIIGRTVIQGTLETDAVVLPGAHTAIASAGAWIRQRDGVWSPPCAAPVDLHPARFIHFYTQSGTLQVGAWGMRDASDVGLGTIGELVDAVVLSPFAPVKEK